MVRAATCHPDRSLCGRGLCRPCYVKAWANGTLPPKRHRPPTPSRRPDCHPDAVHEAKGLCRSCYQHTYYQQNKERYQRLNREWNKRHPLRKPLKERGMTYEQFIDMLAAQGGVCAICGRTTERWCIDHDHKTERVRGILCIRCNAGLGQFLDDTALMNKAIQYLEAA